MNREEVISKVAALTKWWLTHRVNKLKEEKHDSMTINPFLAPIIMKIHNHSSFSELNDFLLGGHFLIGYGTGFGKLIDEKMLPQVFGTKKLDASFRKSSPYNIPEFDDIDHIVKRFDGIYYLSVKAGRWTIQLGQAVELNKCFQKLVQLREQKVLDFRSIIVGTYYGKKETLTDKYQILKGIKVGKTHDVKRIDDVEVLAGRDFWAWINEGEPSTQEWVLEGFNRGISISQVELQKIESLLEPFKNSLMKKYSQFVEKDGSVDWFELLKEING